VPGDRCPPSIGNESLAAAARKHANRMAYLHVLEHQLSGEPDLKAASPRLARDSA